MRYIIGLLLGIGLIVLTFVLIFKALSGGGDNNEPNINLMDYATTDAVVRYTIDGPVNENSTHSRVRVTVGKDQVMFEEIQGYEGKLVQTKTYQSNPQAYAAFLRSLGLAGFTNAREDVDKDERGYCPLGRRYLYEIVDGSDQVQRLWSTSCSVNEGSYGGGRASVIRTLFTRQVPDYSTLTSKIRNL